MITAPAHAAVPARTLYPKWKPCTYAVTFDACGGSCPMASKDVTYGQPYGELPEPVWEGHTFDGWHTETAGGSAVSPSTVMEAGDRTVYAHWKEGMTLPLTYYSDPRSGFSKITVDGATAYSGNGRPESIQVKPGKKVTFYGSLGSSHKWSWCSTSGYGQVLGYGEAASLTVPAAISGASTLCLCCDDTGTYISLDCSSGWIRGVTPKLGT